MAKAAESKEVKAGPQWALLRSLIERAISTAALLMCLASPAAHGQGSPDVPDYWVTQRWVGDVTFLSLNALLAGVSSGIQQELRDGSFSDGFARGALGGAVAYGGRRIVVADFWGAGLIGRQFSAVGNSLVRNAGKAQPSLNAVWLPLGPVTVQLSRDNRVRVTAKPDLYSAGALIAAILDDRLELDVGTSLSSGAPVFRAPHHNIRLDGRLVNGIAPAGLIIVGQPLNVDPTESENTLGHERVHVLQYDFAQMIWGDPLEGYLTRRIPYARTLNNYVRFGVTAPMIIGGFVQYLDVDVYDHPWEIEAFYLTGR
jgi:hypothetical protein